MQPVNLLSADKARRIILGILPSFMIFAPLGSVLVCRLGLSVSEHSGLLHAVVRVVVGDAEAHPDRGGRLLRRHVAHDR